MDNYNNKRTPFGDSFSNGQIGMDRADLNSRQRLVNEEPKKQYKGVLGFFKGIWVKSSKAPMDAMFFILVMLLLCIGLVMVFSVSYTHSYYKYDDGLYLFKQQLKYAIFGVAFMLVVSHIDYRKFFSFLCPAFFGATIGLLGLTFLLNLKKESDFKRWLYIGSFSFQPSEFAKIALIMMMAYVVAKNYNQINSLKKPESRFWVAIDKSFIKFFRRFIPSANVNSLKMTVYYTLLISLVCIMIFIEKHLSCTILVFLLGVSLMWLSGVKKGYFVILAIIVGLAVTVVILKPDILSGYQADRIIAWLDKSYDPLGSRWQTNQSLYAIASGGPFGLGLGNSRQKHMYVSEPQNDFIFAIVCEELGFVGATIIIGLFGLLIWRGFAIAKKNKDIFGAMIVMGICLQIGLQVILNIAVVTDFFPNTGISLPFFSSGGTALVVLLAEIGLVLSVSRRSEIDKA